MKVKRQGCPITPVILVVALLLVLLPLFPGTEAAEVELWEIYSFQEPVLRLHILAHSDTPRDQRIKEGVAVAVHRFLQPRIAAAGPENWSNLEALLPELEQELSLKLLRSGCSMAVTAILVQEWFPLRVYGRYVYPPGAYPALKVTLGRGEGENWWCLLFPPLCLPLAEAQPCGESGNETASEPPPLPTYSSYLSKNEAGKPAGLPRRWTLKIREQMEHWAARAGNK